MTARNLGSMNVTIDPAEPQMPESDDDVLLLIAMRAAIELMRDEMFDSKHHPTLPDGVVASIESADVPILKQVILRSAAELTARLKGPADSP